MTLRALRRIWVNKKKWGARTVAVFIVFTFLFSDISQFIRIPWGTIFRAEAAPVLIEDTLTIVDDSMLNTSPTTVFISDTVGYTFFVDNGNACRYASTTDAGATWSLAYTVDSVNTTDCFRVAVWYDQWTPGDDTGTVIHIATLDTGDDDIFYTSLNTVTNQLSTTVIATNQAGTFAAGTNYHSITKGGDGNLYMAANDASDSWIVRCTGTCTSAGNWSEIANPYELQNDWPLLVPLLNGNIMTIRMDLSGNDYDYNIWNGSIWSGWTTILTTAGENATFDAHFGATIDKRTGDVYFVGVTDNATLGTDDDIRTAYYNHHNGTWSVMGNVLTNDTKGIRDAKIFFDQNSGDVYVTYSALTTPNSATTGNVYYKYSTDGMVSWSSEVQVNTVSGNLFGAGHNNLMSTERAYVTWKNISGDDLFGETVVNLSPPALEQYSYRWYESATSTAPGAPLANANTTATSTERGTPFRLRIALDIDDSKIASSSLSFKLQYAERSGICDISFTGETYTDVLTSSGAVRFYDNTGVASGVQATVSANEPIPSEGSFSYQSYIEGGTFTNTYGSIATSSDGLWDFSLIDISSPEETRYCFRVVYADGSTLESYSVIPELITPSRPPIVTQAHFHFRNDNGGEDDATSATGGVEDTNLFGVFPTTTIRMRIGVENRGLSTSSPIQYRLEYAEKGASCEVSTGWTDVGSSGGAFNMNPIANLTEGGDTTDIAIALGGVSTNESYFVSPNGGVRDTNSQTSAITLGPDEYTDLEYSITATGDSNEGTTYCFRITDAGSVIDSYSVYPQITMAASVEVSTIGSQVTSVNAGTNNFYVGGAFVITDGIGGHSVTSITIAEQGTVDAGSNIENIRLYYDLDTTFPYDCSSESYGGGELQYGATSTSFSSADGTATFNGSVGIDTDQSLCLYVVLDIASGASDGETLEIEIPNASTDVVVSDNPSISPTTFVRLADTTTINSSVLDMTHFHFRNNDGGEGDATSATGGVEDTPVTDLRKNTPIRLRLQVANSGGVGASSLALRLEYGVKVSSCSAVSVWQDVGATEGDWDMYDSTFLTDGDNTTDIVLGIGGVSNEGVDFLDVNGGVKDTSSQTAPFTLAPNEYVELEYSVFATASSTAEGEYCFRVTNQGTPLNVYSVYAEVSIAPNQDFFIQRGFEIVSGTSTILYAGIDYTPPRLGGRAFVRITNTHHTGAGDDDGGGTQNADDVTAYILNPQDIATSITIARPAAATINTGVAWEIVEYQGYPGGGNEMVVREQGNISMTGLFATTSPISGVSSDSDVVVFITGAMTPDTGTADYNMMQAVSSWDVQSQSAVFERGESGDTITLSYAVVEFTGRHWRVQRVAHNYSSAVGAETETIPSSLNSVSRAFLHTQKLAGVGEQGLDEFGHTVWISGVNEISFQLQSGVTTPTAHRSVAWVIENTQVNGTPMNVIQSSGTQSGGAEPSVASIDIGTTVVSMDTTSVFTNSRVNGTNTAFPRPILAVYLISRTQYQFWISDTGGTVTYQTEVVEWPTAPRKITQNYYRIYVNQDTLLPSDVWPQGASSIGENTVLSLNDVPIDSGDVIRIRMSVLVEQGNLPVNYQSFRLQFGERETTCSAVSVWRDVGQVGSTTALWRGYNNGSVTDGATLSSDPPNGGDLVLSVSDRAGTYEESNNSAVNPFPVFAGEDVEYDWVVENNGALELTPYCFRMVEANGLMLDDYAYHPTVFTAGYEAVSEDWRWFDDAENETPLSALSPENSAPIGVDYDTTVQLRVLLHEIAGKTGPQLKLRLQFDESASFTNPQFVSNALDCAEGLSLWCYADGGGVDNATITTAVLTNADSCVSEVGDGCGTHNELATTSSLFTHQPNANTEFAFTIRHVGARANTVYFFRIYDVTNDRYVSASTTKTYPSLVTEGAGLTFTLSGVSSGVITEGITTDNATTPYHISFGTLPLNTEVEVAQRLTVTTNATEGYQVFMFARQGLLYDTEEITPITSLNSNPLGWSLGCDTGSVTGCFGYHTGDDTLAGGSVRFSADDTYARLTTSPQEIIYSSRPVINESTDVIFKTWVNADQPGGLYESSVVYIIVPVF